MKILFSARDPGAALTIKPVILEARNRPDVEFRVLTQPPATRILREAGIAVHDLRTAALRSPDDPAREALFEEVAVELAEFRPDAVVTGISGPGIGVDEALVRLAKTSLVYTVQDMDGLVVPGFGKIAAHYFVSSPKAAELTRARFDVKMTVCGPLKYWHYAVLPISNMRTAGRAAIGAPGKVVTFYGQPAWELKGYFRTIERFACGLAKVRTPLTFLYRPHPKETTEERRITAETFMKSGVPVRLDPIAGIETSLASTDLACSCFSACGVDHVYLQRESPVPLGQSLFLMLEADVLARYRRDCGADYPWEAQAGLAILADEKTAAALPDLIGRALTDEAAEKCWRAIRANIADSADSPKKVLARVFSDFAAA